MSHYEHDLNVQMEAHFFPREETTMNFAYWVHRSGGEKYAVLTDEKGRVVASCGPLGEDECRPEDLPNFDYRTEDAEWLEERTEEFRLFEPRG